MVFRYSWKIVVVGGIFHRTMEKLGFLFQDFDLSDRELDIGPSKGISKVRTCSSASLVNAMPENQQQINK